VRAESSRGHSSGPSQPSEAAKGRTFLDKEEPLANSDHPKRIEPPSGYHKGVEEIGPRSSGLETEVLEPASAKKPALDPVAENLMEQIVDETNMEAAWKKVRSNRGAPGPDGITIDEFPETFRDVWPTLRQPRQEFFRKNGSDRLSRLLLSRLRRTIFSER